MTNEKMVELFDEAMETLGFDGYTLPDGLNPVPTLNRCKSSYGTCRRKYNKEKQRFDYSISFSKYFIAGCSEQDFTNCALHELLHCLFFTDGHKGMWKATAEKLNKKYGLHISRTNCYKDEQGKEVLEANSTIKHHVTYVLSCPKCGKFLIFHRANQYTKYPNHFYCMSCGNPKLICVTNHD